MTAILIRAGAIGVSIAFAAAVLSLAMSQPAAMDFIAHYSAARLVLAGQGPAILDPAAVLAVERAVAPEREVLLPYLRPPAFALVMAPLGALPFTAAFVVTAVLDFVIIATSLWLLKRDDQRLLGAPLVLLVSPPAAIAVSHAQMSPLALLLVALATRADPRTGGFALGLSLLRIQTAPLLLLAGVLDPRRRWWTVAGAVVVVAASAAVVGVEGLIRYVSVLAQTSDLIRTGEVGQRVSIGWTGAALWAGAPGVLGLVISLASLAAGAVMTARARSEDRLAIAALWSLLASPHVLVHDAVLAFPAVLVIASRQRLWDVGSTAAWLAHVLVAPIGVLWSLALALGYRAPQSDPHRRGLVSEMPQPGDHQPVDAHRHEGGVRQERAVVEDRRAHEEDRDRPAEDGPGPR